MYVRMNGRQNSKLWHGRQVGCPMPNGRPPRVPIYGDDRTEATGCKYEEPTELLSTKMMSAEEYNRASL